MGTSGTKPLPFSLRGGRAGVPNKLCIVARHDERADAYHATVDGSRWAMSEDFLDWPLDPPLSDKGARGARETAEMLRYLLEINEICGLRIVCSPYRRCVQTAAHICKALLRPSMEQEHVLIQQALAENMRFVIDYSLGDVYGPSIPGADEPIAPVRGMEETVNYCQGLGVTVEPKAIGEWPVWPESLHNARERLANRFLGHLHRSNGSQCVVILLTHAEGVGAALSLMPSYANSVVEDVGWGGLFFARKESQGLDSDSIAPDVTGFIKQVSADRLSLHGVSKRKVSDIVVGAPVSRASSNDSYVSRASKDSVLQYPPLPRQYDGWQVNTYQITTRKKERIMARLSKSLSSNVGHTSFNAVMPFDKNCGCGREEQIERLLEGLPKRPVAYELAARK